MKPLLCQLGFHRFRPDGGNSITHIRTRCKCGKTQHRNGVL